MNQLHIHPDLLARLAKQGHESMLCEAKMRRLLKHAPSSRSRLQKHAARRLGQLLVQLGSRLQEQQRPIL